MIRLENGKTNRAVKKEIKKLYLEAFPAEERMPLWILSWKAKKDRADLYGIYEKDKFVGMTYCVYEKDIVFVFYLAVHQDRRGEGYGSQILKKLKEKFPNRRIVLNMEEVAETYKNYPQRRKRKEFYLKNGFREAGFKIEEYGVIYEFMYYGENITVEEYENLLKCYFGRGLFHFYQKHRKLQ